MVVIQLATLPAGSPFTNNLLGDIVKFIVTDTSGAEVSMTNIQGGVKITIPIANVFSSSFERMYYKSYLLIKPQLCVCIGTILILLGAQMVAHFIRALRLRLCAVVHTLVSSVLKVLLLSSLHLRRPLFHPLTLLPSLLLLLPLPLRRLLFQSQSNLFRAIF